MQKRRKCSRCGLLGHIKVNPFCPLHNAPADISYDDKQRLIEAFKIKYPTGEVPIAHQKNKKPKTPAAAAAAGKGADASKLTAPGASAGAGSTAGTKSTKKSSKKGGPASNGDAGGADGKAQAKKAPIKPSLKLTLTSKKGVVGR
jgi:hypothetical protein